MKTLLLTLAFISSLALAGQEVVNVKMKSLHKPIIKAEINGKKGYFLVDTGSDISIIDQSQLKHYKLSIAKVYNTQRRAIGFNGMQANVMKVKQADVVIGEEFDHNDFYCFNLDQIAKSIEAETGLRIAGIVGADLLMKYNCIIDYNQRHITMIHNKSSRRFASR